MFLPWRHAHHLQINKGSPYNILRIIKALERAPVLFSVFIGTRVVWCWSDHIEVRGHLRWPPGDSVHAVLSRLSYARTHTHTPRCVSTCSPAAVRGNIHLCNSAFRGYFRGNLLITPSVVSQSTHAPIHQCTAICQSPSLLLVSRVLQVWELLTSSVYSSMFCVNVWVCVHPMPA